MTNKIDRRTIAKGAAWGVPALAVAGSAAAVAASYTVQCPAAPPIAINGVQGAHATVSTFGGDDSTRFTWNPGLWTWTPPDPRITGVKMTPAWETTFTFSGTYANGDPVSPSSYATKQVYLSTNNSVSLTSTSPAYDMNYQLVPRDTGWVDPDKTVATITVPFCYTWMDGITDTEVEYVGGERCCSVYEAQMKPAGLGGVFNTVGWLAIDGTTTFTPTTFDAAKWCPPSPTVVTCNATNHA